MSFAVKEMRIVYHVAYDHEEGRWRVNREGEERVLAWFSSDLFGEPKEIAIKKAVALAKKDLSQGRISQVVIHNRNGSIHSTRVYGRATGEIKSNETAYRLESIV